MYAKLAVAAALGSVVAAQSWADYDHLYGREALPEAYEYDMDDYGAEGLWARELTLSARDAFALAEALAEAEADAMPRKAGGIGGRRGGAGGGRSGKGKKKKGKVDKGAALSDALQSAGNSGSGDSSGGSSTTDQGSQPTAAPQKRHVELDYEFELETREARMKEPGPSEHHRPHYPPGFGHWPPRGHGPPSGNGPRRPPPSGSGHPNNAILSQLHSPHPRGHDRYGDGVEKRNAEADFEDPDVFY